MSLEERPSSVSSELMGPPWVTQGDRLAAEAGFAGLEPDGPHAGQDVGGLFFGQDLGQARVERGGGAGDLGGEGGGAGAALERAVPECADAHVAQELAQLGGLALALGRERRAGRQMVGDVGPAPIGGGVADEIEW